MAPKDKAKILTLEHTSLLVNPSPDPLITQNVFKRRKNYSKDLETMRNKFFTYSGDAAWSPGRSQVGDSKYQNRF